MANRATNRAIFERITPSSGPVLDASPLSRLLYHPCLYQFHQISRRRSGGHTKRLPIFLVAQFPVLIHHQTQGLNLALVQPQRPQVCHFSARGDEEICCSLAICPFPAPLLPLSPLLFLLKPVVSPFACRSHTFQQPLRPQFTQIH